MLSLNSIRRGIFQNSLSIVVHRTTFFFVLFSMVIVPFVAPKLMWLAHSEKARGIMAFEGMGNAGDQIRLDYSIIYFKLGKDTVWFNGMGNLPFRPGEVVPIRYRIGNASDARVDIFAAIWGDTLVYGGIPFLMLLFISLHPGVVPRRSKVRLVAKKPFIRIV